MIHNSSLFTIVGLGNPGEKYEKTRHNAGRMVLEYFRKKNGLPEWETDKRRNALVSKGEVGGVAVELLLPETFMNNSGDAVRYLKTNDYGLTTNLLVVHDDLDLPLGSLKIAYNRGSAGHKGVESVVSALGTNEFTRIRVGIAPDGGDGAAKKPAEPEHFVLQKFTPEEKEKMKKVCGKAAGVFSMIAREGREKAMNAFNKKENRI